MISELLRKWFGLEQIHCESCDILRTQLERSEAERKELLNKLITPSVQPVVAEPTEEFKPIQSQFVPWRIRQQMLEAEDRRSSQLLQQSAKDIAELEKDLGITPIEGVK